LLDIFLLLDDFGIPEHDETRVREQGAVLQKGYHVARFHVGGVQTVHVEISASLCGGGSQLFDGGIPLADFGAGKKPYGGD